MIVLILLFWSALATNAYALSPDLQTFLRSHVGFSQADLQKLEQGMVLTKLLDTDKKPEVAVLGVMHVDVPVDFFVDNYRDIETLMRSSQVVEIGKFDNPPQFDNLRGLTMEPSELQAIKDCEVGNCNMKLPAAVIERFKQEVDWSMPEWQERATELVKEMMVDYVKAYFIGGNAAMGQYDDQKYSLRMADEFHELLQESNYLYEYVPELYQYLEVYPQIELPGVENSIYWSKRKFDKLRPIVSINHVTVFRRYQGKAKALVGSKQIYANHYFEASLELTALVEEERESGKSGFFLLYLNRSRFDSLRKKSIPGMARTIRSEMLKKIDQEMNAIRSQIEALYQEENSPATEQK